jgi:mono/diheme cytochrome c family protein
MLLRAALLTLGFAAAASGAGAQQQQVQRAQAVYTANCAVCHSPSADAPVGDLTRRAPPTFEAIEHAVRGGESPSGEMPAFDESMVSDAELRALHAYINSVRARR